MAGRVTKCVHVLATEKYAPEICEITIPTIKGFAERIGADFNLINTRKFLDFPVNYERMQIHEAGAGYDWNFNIDADMVIGKQLQDITEIFTPESIRIVMAYEADRFFETKGNVYFERDGRNLGIVDAFILSSKHTHDIWTPLPGTMSDYAHLFKDGHIRRISEYCISQNAARFGIKYGGAFSRTDQIFHIGYTSGDTEDAAYIARAKASDWGW